HFNRFDPNYCISNRITCNINWLCKELLKNIQFSSNELLNTLYHLSNVVSRTLEETFSSFETIYEPYIPHMISKLSGTLPCSIFFGNSMPIRDADNLFYPEASGIEVFVNRGMSGIDGNISTAIGIALAKLRPMIAVLGDITFLHDMGSIEKLSESTIPIIIFVINNGGGGIFSFLPIVKKEKEFEEFFATAHVNRFYKISEFADVEFYSPTTTNELDDLWNDLQQQPRTCIIEILTNREENLAVHVTITEIVKNSLCSSPLHSAL
ncbi:MAG: hypothetical protein FJZ57_05090, partial [Chlamydiae bacterium]|nr:hypothetical protein [Chlamydiota bacterium]